MVLRKSFIVLSRALACALVALAGHVHAEQSVSGKEISKGAALKRIISGEGYEYKLIAGKLFLQFGSEENANWVAYPIEQFEADMNKANKKTTIVSAGYKYEVSWNGTKLVTTNLSGFEVMDFLKDMAKYSTEDESTTEVWTHRYELLSVVGPYVSVNLISSGYTDPSAHPWGDNLIPTANGSKATYVAGQPYSDATASLKIDFKVKNGGRTDWRGFSAAKVSSADLRDMVTEVSLAQAIKKADYVRAQMEKSGVNLSELDEIQTLPALDAFLSSNMYATDEGVGWSYEGQFEKFAVWDYSPTTDLMEVRLYLESMSGASRGSLVEIPIKVTPNQAVKQILSDMKSNKTGGLFMKDVPHRPATMQE